MPGNGLAAILGRLCGRSTAALRRSSELGIARAEIREAYGESAQEAGAKRDQALAKLFYRSGWTQTELAQVEHVTQKTMSQRLLFGRFLNFIPEGINLEKTSLSFFLRQWKRTDKTETNERIRFRNVQHLTEQSTLTSPPKSNCGPSASPAKCCDRWPWTAVGK